MGRTSGLDANKRLVAQNPIRALGKAALLLERLAEEGESTPRRLAEAIGEPRTTVYRLLSALEAVGFVEDGNEAGSFRLGWNLMRLGSSVIERLDERKLALPVMEDVLERCGETVYLCVRRDDLAVCIERLEGLHVQSLVLRLGGTLPLHVGAAPRALLAWEPRDEWQDYVTRNKLAAYTPSTPTTRAQLVAELEATFDRGYAISDEDLTPGIASLGVPIFDYTGKIKASLSIGGLKSVMLGPRQDELVEMLIQGAAVVSSRLGARLAEIAG